MIEVIQCQEQWKEILEPVDMPAFFEFDDFYDYDMLRLLHEYFAPPPYMAFKYRVGIDENNKITMGQIN